MLRRAEIQRPQYSGEPQPDYAPRSAALFRSTLADRIVRDTDLIRLAELTNKNERDLRARIVGEHAADQEYRRANRRLLEPLEKIVDTHVTLGKSLFIVAV